MKQDYIYENNNQGLDLNDIFSTLWRSKLLIVSITSVFAILSVIIALILPNKYTSSTLLVPVAQEDSLSSRLGGFSSLAGLAGVSLPSESSSKSKEAIERIKSFQFFSSYFLPNIKLENITAVKKWDQNNNKLIYDEKLFDEKTGKWKESKPSTQEAFKIYSEILGISQDKLTSFVGMSIEHHSPYIAQEWVNIIIYEINESMRKLDADQAQKSIEYLNNTSSTTNIQSIRDVIAKLLEEQIQTLMFSESSESYVFKVIDSPIAPEKKSKPSRAIICILGTFLGFLISLVVVFFRELAMNNRNDMHASPN